MGSRAAEATAGSRGGIRVARHVAGLPPSGIREFFELVRAAGTGPDEAGRRLISLAIGEPDFDAPWHVREAAIWAIENGRTGYTPNLGLQRLREAIADHVLRETGVAYDPEREILVTVGVSQGLDLALRSLVEPGDEVLFLEPAYVSYGPSVLLAFGVPAPVETCGTGGFRVDAAAVEARVTDRSRVLLLNFPGNPTGTALGRGEGQALARIAETHDLIVISDEIYAELTYEGAPVSFVSIGAMRDRTILLRGLSKAFAMTGFRIGYACGPASLIEGMARIHQYAMLCAPSPSQEAAVDALRNGRVAMEAMREQFRLRRNYLVRSLNELGLPCHMPQGAFYAFPSIAPTGLTSREFATRLLVEQRVAVVPGSAFGRAGERYVRCAYAASLAALEEAVDRIAAFLSRLG